MALPCVNEERLKQIERILNGNGQPGLVQKITKIEEKMETTEKSLSSLASSFKALYEFQLEHDVTEKVKAKAQDRKFKTIEVVAKVFGVVVALITILTFVDKFLN